MKKIGMARALVAIAALAVVTGACTSSPAASGRRGRHRGQVHDRRLSNPVGSATAGARRCCARPRPRPSRQGNVTKVSIIHRDTDAAGQLADIRT